MWTRCSSQASSCSNPHASMPTSRRLSPFPRPMSRAPRRLSMSVSVTASASEIRSPPRHSTAISALILSPCLVWPAWRTRMISSARGGSGGYFRPLLGGTRPHRKPGVAAGERRRLVTSSNGKSDMNSSSRSEDPRAGRSPDAHRPIVSLPTEINQPGASASASPWAEAAAESPRRAPAWCLVLGVIGVVSQRSSTRLLLG